MDIKQFVNEEILKLHKKTILESELKKVEGQIKILKEEDGSKDGQEQSYNSNVYESYKKDLEGVVHDLAEACNKLETAVLRQESHMKTLPEVSERKNAGESSKQIILDIFREVKKAKIAAERKLYEMS